MKNPLLTFAAWAARSLPPDARRRLYHLGPVTRLLRRSLNQAAPSGITPVQVAAGPLKGILLSLDLQSEKDYWLGTYETELLQVLKQWVRPGQTVYDIGANVGYLSMILSRWVGSAGVVHAFEALPKNVDRFRNHVEANDLPGQINIHAFAITDQRGMSDFYVHDSTAMGKAAGSAGRDIQYNSTLDLPSISIDAFIFEDHNPPPDLIKIDIEGGEVLAFPGMVRTLRQKRPLIFAELHGQEAAKTTWIALKNAGYAIFQLQDPTTEIQNYETLDWKAYLVALPPNHSSDASGSS